MTKTFYSLDIAARKRNLVVNKDWPPIHFLLIWKCYVCTLLSPSDKTTTYHNDANYKINSVSIGTDFSNKFVFIAALLNVELPEGTMNCSVIQAIHFRNFSLI